jgi:hypothetical protein
MSTPAGEWAQPISAEGADLLRARSVSLIPKIGYITPMKPIVPLADKLSDETGATERGYDAWKRAKVERGLAQAKNRAAMIPAEQVLDTLKLAR